MQVLRMLKIFLGGHTNRKRCIRASAFQNSFARTLPEIGSYVCVYRLFDVDLP